MIFQGRDKINLLNSLYQEGPKEAAPLNFGIRVIRGRRIVLGEKAAKAAAEGPRPPPVRKARLEAALEEEEEEEEEEDTAGAKGRSLLHEYASQPLGSAYPPKPLRLGPRSRTLNMSAPSNRL